MKIVSPGALRHYANQTTMSNHLVQAMVSRPEVIPQVATVFENESTPFTSLLANKGLTSKGLYAGVTNSKYRVVGNRKVMWPVKGIDRRKGRIMNWTCDNLTQPGYGGEVVTLDIDTDWFSPYDVLELKDNRTLVTVVSDILPVELDGGLWRYYVKLNRGSKTDFIDPELLNDDAEIGWVMTNFYEMSETAYEKYTFDNWAYSYMTIQRMKWSISGTAAAMKTEKYWLKHRQQMTWVTEAEMKMLKRWAEAREYQNIFGKGTVGENDEILLRDMKGRDIMAGDGLLNIGDGSLQFPYNVLTKEYIENIMKNMNIFHDYNGVQELLCICGQDFYLDFQRLMKNEFGLEPSVMKEGSGASKGVNATFAYYELGGVRITPMKHKWFGRPDRPQDFTDDGIVKESKRAIFVSLGQADIGTNNIELLQLGDRGFKKGVIGGIDKGGDNMKASVDGSHSHILMETGIRVTNMYGVAEAFAA